METGIIRRIDDLGRVVIPKEMRKTLRIKEGDPLEIFTNKEELVFKKYSPIESVGELTELVAKGLENICEKTCVITDTDKIIYASSKCKDFIGKEISSELASVIKERKSILNSKGDGGKIIPLVKNDDYGIENQIVVPIINGGDCYGTIILADKDKTLRFSSQDVNIVRLGAYVLAEQFSV